MTANEYRGAVLRLGGDTPPCLLCDDDELMDCIDGIYQHKVAGMKGLHIECAIFKGWAGDIKEKGKR